MFRALPLEEQIDIVAFYRIAITSKAKLVEQQAAFAVARIRARARRLDQATGESHG